MLPPIKKICQVHWTILQEPQVFEFFLLVEERRLIFQAHKCLAYLLNNL